MKLLSTFLLSACLASQAVAEFTFKVEATFKGKPVPQSEIKLVAIDRKQSPASTTKLLPDKAKAEADPAVKKRANPTATSANWCGSINHATTLNQIKLIHTYFQHPTCTIRSGQSYPQAVAAWAGIDGDSWTSALLQSGTVCKIDNSTGIVRNEAWWQWLPNGAYTISSMPVAANDWFELTINTTSSTAAKITLANLNQGYTYAITISGGQALGRIDADWVVERPMYGSGLAGFATFTDVWFQDAYATRVTSGSVGILGATQWQIPSLCASSEYDNANEVSWSL
ncbi:concanavalin A-like lectin/glucanase domain-containing protein [Cercophora newfieldiana]|uniref:Concanavalin A-like lectin/glucanase domain-containing protein n=1 Tax=Cercophora newfieldiana TaxID=92897 RepID=A0AA40CN15_9PEZI|nr:concanavalin A-like lectin/glucanase domain-containing protein [Cercophora newfieldiana]